MTSNRVWNLRELDRPFFRQTVASMKRLIEEFLGFYLYPNTR